MSGHEILVLGTLEVRVDGEPIRVSGRRQRALLACLVLAHGAPVSTAELVASIYGEDAGEAAVHSLHELVSSLRRSLEPSGIHELLRTATRGYELDLEGERVDAWRFDELVLCADDEDDPARRSDLLRQALDLWRGPVLADVDLDGRARLEAERLDESRWAALGEWCDLELAAGLNAAALAELDRARRLNPLNERFAAQMMLALYRDGRQAEALAIYHETRKLLAGELGLEPTERLRSLERRILNHDPALFAPPGTRRRSRAPRTRRRLLAAAAATAIAAGTALVVHGLLADNGRPAVFADSLKGVELDTSFWDVATFGAGPSVRPDGDGVRLTIPAHAAVDEASGALKARLASYCTVAGEFDVQVDYNLRSWPPANGAGIGMYAAYADVMRSSSRTGEHYVGAYRKLDPPDGPPHAFAATDDKGGTLRIVRRGDRMIELIRDGGRWRQLYAFGDATPAPVSVYLELWTTKRRFANRQVEVQLTNFRVNTGSLQCR